VSKSNYNGGRLVADRYDVQNHIDGVTHRHNANKIVLSPSITIDGIIRDNVQDAIGILKDLVNIVDIDPDATNTNTGNIQLAGDIDGIAINIVVKKIQGNSISSITPIDNSFILQWNSATSQWTPISISNSFTLYGDVMGPSSASAVVNLHGNPISNTIPNTDQILVWGASSWSPGDLTMSGNVTSTTNSDTTVTSLQNYAVNAMPSLNSNNVLVWSGAWITGYLPLSGDISGTANSSSVNKLQGVSVTSGTPNSNNLLVYNSGVWGLNFLTMGASGGDVTNNSGNANVSKIQTVPVGAGAPASNSTLIFSGGSWQPLSFSMLYRQQSAIFLTNGSWTAPAGVSFIIAEGFGGGGGGGGGGAGDASGIAKYSIGGGGGGASLASTRIISVTPGNLYGIAIGIGGLSDTASGRGGSSSGGYGVLGQYGDPTYISHGGVILEMWQGAGGGVGGGLISSATNYLGFSSGGSPTFNLNDYQIKGGSYFATSIFAHPNSSRQPGFGGNGIDKRGIGSMGSQSIEGFGGGNMGAKGTDVVSSNYFGGGPGGGGAGGPNGIGATGGYGGNGGSSIGGGPGLSAADNSGAGGGGGGGGGQTIFSFAPGGYGGNGGSGMLKITWWAKV
jgi:hypothetical protein